MNVKRLQPHRGLRSSASAFSLLALLFLCALSLLWSYLQTDSVSDIFVILEDANEFFFEGDKSSSLASNIETSDEDADDSNLEPTTTDSLVGLNSSNKIADRTIVVDMSNHKVHHRGPNNALVEKSSDEANRNVKHARNPLVGLNCDAHGGPDENIAKEMVYWEDIPSDSLYVSQFKKEGVTQYLTFEPDGAGWNNVRMGLETIIVMAYAMGRTLVLPPEEGMWVFPGKHNGSSFFSFSNFYPLATVANEHAGLEIITMQEFLEREALTGNIRDKNGIVSFPPGNRTHWDEAPDMQKLKNWLREVGNSTVWDPDKCLAAFPASSDPKDIQPILDIKESVEKAGGFPPYKEYIGKPHPVNASAIDRMKENWAEYWIGGKGLCIYDQEKQNAHLIHFPFDYNSGSRLLTHFYAFLFFQDWRQDLWMKRFVRDHIRYVDSLQCAAARIVNAIRERSRARGDPDGNFDTFHIRRDDFGSQFSETQHEADRIYEISKAELVENATVYISTDERNRSYFDPMRQHYDIVFLENFRDQIKDVNEKYHGMIEQLVASRGRAFFGCWLSTFTNYINRLRGYHANKAKIPGYENGTINSWYYTPQHRDDMRVFVPVYQGYYFREFPTSWRLINTGIDEMKDFLAKPN